MVEFILHSAILRSAKSPKACAEGVAKMLTTGKIKDIQVKSCYCATGENRLSFLIEAPSRDAVLEAMEKFDVPVASIMQVEKVEAK